MTDELLVWRDERIHATLAERRGRLSLSYESDARPISLSLAVRSTAHHDDLARPWFKGLLPEGQIRLAISYEAGVGPDDDFGLLRVLGRDCAGALSLRTSGDPASHDRIGPLLTDRQIGSLLRTLPTSPMGFDDGFRVSLPGRQHKLLLARDAATPEAGGWHRPDGAPSTHILKPAIGALGRSTVGNEAYCQWLATAAGLPAAHTEIAEFDGIEVLVSERFDRVRRSDGSVHRVHQEDGCQMLSIGPGSKYQTADGGASLRAIARVLSANGGDLDPLLRIATFTVVIGNADWHGKNVSLTFDDDDRVAVSPIYDAMSTRFYETTSTGAPVERTLGMHIAGHTDIDSVRREHLVDEGRSWGISSARATRVVNETTDNLRLALDHIESPIGGLNEMISRRLSALGE